jgi:hypothetical protein
MEQLEKMAFGNPAYVAMGKKGLFKSKTDKATHFAARAGVRDQPTGREIRFAKNNVLNGTVLFVGLLAMMQMMPARASIGRGLLITGAIGTAALNIAPGAWLLLANNEDVQRFCKDKFGL